MSNKDSQKSFFTNLWERRFFQFFATYIAASWGAIQFLEWGVKRYAIPSGWVDKLVVFLLVMLPLVVCVIYFHGKPGDDKWLKFEKVFYPINVIIALVMSMFLVNTTAESVTEVVTVTNVEGLSVEREIPKQKYNKKVVVFPVEGETDEASWQGVAVSELLNNKLEQDMSIIVSSAASISEIYEDYGYRPFQEIPFATKLNISVDNYSDFFVASKFLDDSHSKIDVGIFNTKTGEEVYQEVVDGVDIYDATEKVSLIINYHIKLSEGEGKELYVDLPTSNLISSNVESLQGYTESMILLAKEPNKVLEAYNLLNQAVEKDPTCAECWSMMSYTRMMSGQDQTDEMTNALRYAESLPERQQLSIKYYNYLSKNDTDKAIKLCQMWRKLYPHDSKPVSNLMAIYGGMFRIEDAKEAALSAINDGHKGTLYIKYANLLIQTKDWEQAELYLKKYKETYPKQFEATSLLVDTYAGKGQSDKALDALDELIIMKPREKSYLLKKAGILSKLNKFDKSLKILKTALAESETTSDSIANYTKQLEVLARSMDYENYGKVRRELKNTFIRNYPPIQYLQTEYATVGYYKYIDQTDSIIYHINKITSQVAPSRRPLVKDVNNFKDGLDESYNKVKPMFESMGSKFVIFLYSSEIKYIQGDYKEALDLFEKCKAEATDAAMVSNNYHETHMKLGMFDEGLVVVNDLLADDPLNPMLRLYKAQFLNKLGKSSEAKSALEPVMDVFNKGDQRYVYTAKAKSLASSLGI